MFFFFLFFFLHCLTQRPGRYCTSVAGTAQTKGAPQANSWSLQVPSWEKAGTSSLKWWDPQPGERSQKTTSERRQCCRTPTRTRCCSCYGYGVSSATRSRTATSSPRSGPGRRRSPFGPQSPSHRRLPRGDRHMSTAGPWPRCPTPHLLPLPS